MIRQKHFLIPLFLFATIALGFTGCGTTQPPYHGFASQSLLDQKDEYVLTQSVGGNLDPKNMAIEDQRYTHDNIAYNRMEEGYYQWGKKMYEMGYRDEFYVQDLAPRAFRHDVLDTYNAALKAGYEEAQKADPNK